MDVRFGENPCEREVGQRTLSRIHGRERIVRFGWGESTRGGVGFFTNIPHAIINIMEVGDVRFYKERLKALDEIERLGQRALTMNERWQKLNALAGLGRILGWKEDESELEIVRARWIKLKDHYEKTVKQN